MRITLSKIRGAFSTLGKILIFVCILEASGLMLTSRVVRNSSFNYPMPIHTQVNAQLLAQSRTFQSLRATVSFKHPLSANEIVSFFSQVQLKPHYLYFVESEGRQVIGGYAVTEEQEVIEMLAALSQARLRATRSYISSLEKELRVTLPDEARTRTINVELDQLRIRLSSPEVVPQIYASNIEADLDKLEYLKGHIQVHTVQILQSYSSGEPIFPRP